MSCRMLGGILSIQPLSLSSLVLRVLIPELNQSPIGNRGSEVPLPCPYNNVKFQMVAEQQQGTNSCSIKSSSFTLVGPSMCQPEGSEGQPKGKPKGQPKGQGQIWEGQHKGQPKGTLVCGQGKGG